LAHGEVLPAPTQHEPQPLELLGRLRPRRRTFERTWTRSRGRPSVSTSTDMITTSRPNPTIARSTLLTRTLSLPRRLT
jgi:hypothetical protein